MQHNGFIAISTMLIISVVVLSIAISVTYLSIGEAQSSLSQVKGEESLSFVEGCVEDALNQVRATSSYAGGAITRPEGTCQITVVSKVGTLWTLDITSASTDYNRTVRVVVTRNSKGLDLSTWQEI